MISNQVKRAVIRRIASLKLEDFSEELVQSGIIRESEKEEAENEYRQFLLLNFLKRSETTRGLLAPSRRALELWRIICQKKYEQRNINFCKHVFGDNAEPLIISKELSNEEVYEQALQMSKYFQWKHCRNVHGFTNYYDTCR
jgi:hypothetical protein